MEAVYCTRPGESQRDFRSKSLPFCRPSKYLFVFGTNSRGGGNSETGNVCEPTCGGGVGTVEIMSETFQASHERIDAYFSVVLHSR